MGQANLFELKQLLQKMESIYNRLNTEKNKGKQNELQENFALIAGQFKEKVSKLE